MLIIVQESRYVNWSSECLILKVWPVAHHVFLLTLSWSPWHPETIGHIWWVGSENTLVVNCSKCHLVQLKLNSYSDFYVPLSPQTGVKDYYECSLKCCRQDSFPAVSCWMQREGLGEVGSLSEDTSSSWVYIRSKCQQQGQSHHVSLLDCSCSALLKYLMCLQSQTSACTRLGCLDNIISSGCSVNKIWESDGFQLSNSAKL